MLEYWPGMPGVLGSSPAQCYTCHLVNSLWGNYLFHVYFYLIHCQKPFQASWHNIFNHFFQIKLFLVCLTQSLWLKYFYNKTITYVYVYIQLLVFTLYWVAIYVLSTASKDLSTYLSKYSLNTQQFGLNWAYGPSFTQDEIATWLLHSPATCSWLFCVCIWLFQVVHTSLDCCTDLQASPVLLSGNINLYLYLCLLDIFMIPGHLYSILQLTWNI